MCLLDKVPCGACLSLIENFDPSGVVHRIAKSCSRNEIDGFRSGTKLAGRLAHDDQHNLIVTNVYSGQTVSIMRLERPNWVHETPVHELASRPVHTHHGSLLIDAIGVADATEIPVKTSEEAMWI